MSKLVDDALAKFMVGDGVTDKELDALIEVYTTAHNTLGTLMKANPYYGFAYNDSFQSLTLLQGFKDARERK